MLPGPTIIRECSACGKHIEQHTIESGNTFGARFWTDGKRQAPMLPDQLWLVKCPHCHALVWIDELKKIGEIELWGARGETAKWFEDPWSTLEPTLAEYAAFLSSGILENKKERYVRLRIWWAGNDTRRGVQHATTMTNIETENLRSLLALLDERKDNDRIMKAEALRELGMFEDVEELLAKPLEERLMQAAGLICTLSRKRDSAVAEMKFK